ncbi:hypothetical protein PTTG_04936 [Puccinia triticina 1-1 BBBD Race 1]|uniref:Uncharacterized protein n=1 Tax=Puccinia triticina (isolate 1-1 / race 1 (BBBD)) TaxID=630390 RepID=A0A180G218_PUCT1|nr:hypothetical protein PTTG_04936 [Puccinia triticina 1-1 BBBD Race 1]
MNPNHELHLQRAQNFTPAHNSRNPQYGLPNPKFQPTGNFYSQNATNHNQSHNLDELGSEPQQIYFIDSRGEIVCAPVNRQAQGHHPTLEPNNPALGPHRNLYHQDGTFGRTPYLPRHNAQPNSYPGPFHRAPFGTTPVPPNYTRANLYQDHTASTESFDSPVGTTPVTRRAPQENQVPPVTRSAPQENQVPADNSRALPKKNHAEINKILRNLTKDRCPSNTQPTSGSNPPPCPEDEVKSDKDASENAAESRKKDIESENTCVPGNVNKPGQSPADDGENAKNRITELPEEIMEEIVGMELDELREYEALHATSKCLPSYLKAEVNELYYEFERQLYIFAIRYQLHVALLYMHIGQINRMRGPTSYNNFCRYDPEAREIFSQTVLKLKERCTAVAQVWKTFDPATKLKYKDPAFLESICGDKPLKITNGVVQTARDVHISNTKLTLGSNQKSITFVRRWVKETVRRMNEIAACHRIQGMLVVASAKSLGDLFIQEGTKMGNAFLNILTNNGDPLRKFHTYVAGMSVVAELTNKDPNELACANEIHPRDSASVSKSKPAQKKRKLAELTNNDKQEDHQKDKYCQGTLKDNKKLISQKLLALLSGKKFRGWPGKNAARDLKAAHISVKVKRNNPDRFIADELCQPINAISIETSERILRALGEGWVQVKFKEDASSNEEENEGHLPSHNKRARLSCRKAPRKISVVNSSEEDEASDQESRGCRDQDGEDEDEEND